MKVALTLLVVASPLWVYPLLYILGGRAGMGSRWSRTSRLAGMLKLALFLAMTLSVMGWLAYFMTMPEPVA